MTIRKAIAAPTMGLAVAATALLGSGAANAGVTYTDAGHSYTGTQSTGMHSNLPMLAPGVQEFGLSGSLNWTDDTLYNLQLSYGRFFTPNWLLGIRGGFQGENSDIDFNLGLFAEYNFLTGSQWVPFIGVSADWARLDSGAFDADAIQVGAVAGVKYFFRPNIAISASFGGSWVSDTLPDGDDFNKQIDLGLRFYF